MVTPFRIGVPLTGGFQSVPQPPQMPSYVQFRPNYRPRGPRPQMQPQNITRNLPEENLLFVGNIDDRVPNDLMHAIFDCCGSVEKWQRLQGPDGRLPAFGFVGFREPAAAILALKCLHNFKIGNKALNVRPDEKARQNMFEHVRRERALQDLPRLKIGSELDIEPQDLPYIEQTQDRIIEVIRNTHAHLLIEQVEEEEPPRPRSKSPLRFEKDRFRRKFSRERRKSPNSEKKRKRRRSSSSDSTSTLGGRRSPSPGHESDDSDLIQEKKLRKREQKRREEDYLRQLKRFEERERRQAKQYTKEDEDDLAKQKNLQKEAKKLEQFLEDYIDERDDPKYYRSSSYLKRRKEYDHEREMDRIDREAEQREIEKLKESMLNNTKEESASSVFSPDLKKEPSDDNTFKYSFTSHETTTRLEAKMEAEPSTSQNGQDKKVVTSIQQKVISNVISVFGEDDPDEENTHVIKKKIKKFEITHQERMESLTEAERKHIIKSLINDIPTTKNELFALPMDWDLVDAALMNDKIQPWLQKKIREYIGEDEPTLVKFIVEKITMKAEPSSLLQDLSMILDEEAESFVVKLWRLIIFESKAKKMGLKVGQNSTQ